jgi:signal transduction histidine kinase
MQGALMDEHFRTIVSQMAELVTCIDQEKGGNSATVSIKQAKNIATEMAQIFSALNEAVILISKEGLPVFANPPAMRLLDLNPIGRPIEKVIQKLKLTDTVGKPISYEDLPIKDAFEGRAIYGERFGLIDPSNNTRFFSISSYPLIVDKKVSGAAIVLRDETGGVFDGVPFDMKRETSALKAIFNSAPEAIVVVDENCRIIMSNPRARWLYGQQWFLDKPESSYPDGPPNDIIAVPLGKTVFKGAVIEGLEMEYQEPGKPVKHILVNTSPIRGHDGKITGGVGIFHDITERKLEKLELQRIREELEKRVEIRTLELSETVETLRSEIQERERIEHKLRQSQAELKIVSRKMLDTLEADRKTIAKELHDSIGASLAAIKFTLEDKLIRMTSAPPKDIVSLEQIVDYLVDTIKETKRISANLRPSTMDDLGLCATISWFCREFKMFYKNIEVNQDIDIRENDISEPMKIVIYRILQEAMSNAAKHGNPDKIDLALKKNHDNLYLTIFDDGPGFEQENGLISTDPLSGHGITGMKERAEVCGGRFKVTSRSGWGTLVEVVLPITGI